jgi:hypothetical protein
MMNINTSTVSQLTHDSSRGPLAWSLDRQHLIKTQNTCLQFKEDEPRVHLNADTIYLAHAKGRGHTGIVITWQDLWSKKEESSLK